MNSNTDPRLIPGALVYQHQQPFTMASGQVLSELCLAYETYGQLSPSKDNVVIVHHALSTHSHLRSHSDNPKPGWWQAFVGPGCAIDTDRFFVICVNNLGSCFGSTGPASVQPGTEQTYAMSFPAVSLVDIVNTQRLLLAHLGIEHLHAVIGPSMGGMLSLVWATLYPSSVRQLILISTSLSAYPTNVGLHQVQRDMICLDPAWQAGDYLPFTILPGFVAARKIGHLTYRNNDELNHRFTAEIQDHEGGIKQYLSYNAEKFVQRFDANSYLYLTEAMDAFDLNKIVQEHQVSLSNISAQVKVVAVDSDILFPAWQQRALADALLAAKVDCQFTSYSCDYGHDAFLVEHEGMGGLIGQYLTE